jgi:hypothetical protein
MTSTQDRPGVVVIDIRDGMTDLADLAGSVVVLDDAETAADHNHVYQTLLGSRQVAGVICLAVGGGDGGDGALQIRPPQALGPAERGATLWVGHPHGIQWCPTMTLVHRNEPAEPSVLAQLIDALGDPAVFDAVVTCVSRLHYSTASVGVALERAGLHDAELSRVDGEAVVQFTDPDAGQTVAQDLPRVEFRAATRALVQIDPTEDVLVVGGELITARTHAFDALASAEHTFTRLDHRAAPFVRDRPGLSVGAAVTKARAAALDLHEKATRQLRRIDAGLRGDRVTAEVVGQLGVRNPVPARPREVRDEVRDLVIEWLGRYRSVPHLVRDIDAERITISPQGCNSAISELETLAPLTGDAPRFALWPQPGLAVLLALLIGTLAWFGIAPQIVIAVLLVVGFSAVLLLHARKPTATGELGFRAALLLPVRNPTANGELGYLAALVAVMFGWLLLVFLMLDIVLNAGETPAGSLGWGAVWTGCSVLLFATTAAASWRRSVRRWRRSLDLGSLRAGIARTDQLLDAAIRTQWRPSARRALVAGGLQYASIGLITIREVIAGRADNLFASPTRQQATDGNGSDPDRRPDRDVYQELREVVVTDLVDLTIAALRPCWAGIEAGRPAEPTEYVQETERLLAVYRKHVARHGLLAPPPFARDRAHRAALATRLWAGSQVAEALVRGVDDEMTQLCHAGQLVAVSAMAEGAQPVRFAPAAVRELVDAAKGNGPVTWTGDTAIAGTLRLVPLRQGVIQ